MAELSFQGEHSVIDRKQIENILYFEVVYLYYPSLKWYVLQYIVKHSNLENLIFIAKNCRNPFFEMSPP